MPGTVNYEEDEQYLLAVGTYNGNLYVYDFINVFDSQKPSRPVHVKFEKEAITTLCWSKNEKSKLFVGTHTGKIYFIDFSNITDVKKTLHKNLATTEDVNRKSQAITGLVQANDQTLYAT